MKTRLLSTVILFILGSLLIANEVVAQTTEEIKFEQIKLNNSSSNNPIEVMLKINPQQPISNEGLKFIIVLKNTLGKSFKLKNPFDALSLKLVDTDGGNLIIPHRTNHERNETDPYLTKLESFNINRVSTNGKVETKDFSTTRFFIIPANGTFEMELAIKTVLRDSPKTTSTIKGDIIMMKLPAVKENTPRTTLKKGQYSLKMTIEINNSRDSDSYYVGLFDIPRIITVRYGL